MSTNALYAVFECSVPMLCMQCLNGSVVLRGVWDVQSSNRYYINNGSMKHQVGSGIVLICIHNLTNYGL